MGAVNSSWSLIRLFFFFFSSRRRHTRCGRDWSSDVCSSDLGSSAGAEWRKVAVHYPRVAVDDGIVIRGSRDLHPERGSELVRVTELLTVGQEDRKSVV